MLGAVLVSLRPRQWVKNLFVFAGLVFGQRLFTPAVWPALGAFAIFCGLSGAVYLFNDVADRHKDRLHPDKRHRPIAAGRLAPGAALTAAAVLIAVGLAASVWLSPRFALAAVTYVGQMIAVVTASTVTAYALYTMSPETVAKFHTQLLPATLPFVLYGIFRYLYLLYHRRIGGNPSEIVVRDRALLVNALLWLATVLLIIYGTRLE